MTSSMNEDTKRFRLSHRYGLASTKMLDGIQKGSSLLWANRASKGFGHYPHTRDNRQIESPHPPFDYTPEQIALARNIRGFFYERLLSHTEIRTALQYSPVCIDIEVFESSSGDLGGIFTLPDSDDKKMDLSHVVMVYGSDENGLQVDTGWTGWGDHGHGYITNAYLERHFITGFASAELMRGQIFTNAILHSKKKTWINGRKWFENVYQVASCRDDDRPLYNIEILTNGGVIAAWTHIAYEKPTNTFEILELFVLPENRRLGVGTHLFQKILSSTRNALVTGYIPCHDLGSREEAVRDFLLANDHVPIVDRSRFKDCRFRIERLPPSN